MSQYLNIYIKAKERNKPLFFTQYSRSSEVYDIITEEHIIPYNGDGETYCDLPLSTLQSCLTRLKEQREEITQKETNRKEALEHIHNNKKAVSDILEELDDCYKFTRELDEEIKEVSHLVWLASTIADCKEYSWGDIEGLMANIG